MYTRNVLANSSKLTFMQPPKAGQEISLGRLVWLNWAPEVIMKALIGQLENIVGNLLLQHLVYIYINIYIYIYWHLAHPEVYTVWVLTYFELLDLRRVVTWGLLV